MPRYTTPTSNNSVGDILNGIIIKSIDIIEEIHVCCYELQHIVSGARIIFLNCYDEDNLFAISFNTPPDDSTGVAHILEHCILQGSQSFPLRDVIRELSQTSFATVLNAMTLPDKTIYQVITSIHKDYFNLAAVYLDLVFHPILSRETFMQEAYHFEFTEVNNTSSELIVTGVAYNEMRGAYSIPGGIIAKKIQSGLFPDTCYAYDSGGQPDQILNLTLEKLKSFHDKYYNASNATFFLYGDIPLAEHCAFLEKHLRNTKSGNFLPTIKKQAHWGKPVLNRVAIPSEYSDRSADNVSVSIAWIGPDICDFDECNLLSILSKVLIGTATSPLRIALINSGFCQDVVASSGFKKYLIQSYFVLNLRGCNPSRIEEIENLILSTLSSIAIKGIDTDEIESAILAFEFEECEIAANFRLNLLTKLAINTYCEGELRKQLEMSTVIRKLRNLLKNNKQIFSRTIMKWMIDNKHRLTTIAHPETGLSREKALQLRSQLAHKRGVLSELAKQRIVDEAIRLKESQNVAEKSNILSRLPKLLISDIPQQIRRIPFSQSSFLNATILEVPLFTNGIFYIDFSFSASNLGDDDSLWVPLLGRLAVNSGAAGLDYLEMTKHVNRYTGGAHSTTFVGTNLTTSADWGCLKISGKALGNNVKDLLTILRDYLLHADFDNKGRTREILHTMRNQMRNEITDLGSGMAFLAAGSTINRSRYLAEKWKGISQYRFLSSLADANEVDSIDVASKADMIKQSIFTRDNLLVTICGDPGLIEKARNLVEDLISELPNNTLRESKRISNSASKSIGICIDSQVNFVSKALPVPSIKDERAATIEVLSFIANRSYIYNKIRVQGCAYGANCNYFPIGGLLQLVSYRDPNIVRTLEVFEELPSFVRTISSDMIERSRIGIIARYNNQITMSPLAAISEVERNYLSGVSNEDKIAFQEGLGKVNQNDLQNLVLPLIEEEIRNAPKAVLGSYSAIERANVELKSRGYDPFSIEYIEDRQA